MSRAGRGHRLLAAVVAVAAAAGYGAVTGSDETLVVHVRRNGEEVISSRADVLFNPASIVKLATTLWALERLGPEHRFETVVLRQGTIDQGRLNGNLIVTGGGDPDFHAENAFLLSEAMNRAGVMAIDGDLLVNGPFWMGWENGSERPSGAPDRRTALMARRLATALQPSRWDRSLREAWQSFARRHQRASGEPPGVVIRGEVGVVDALTGYEKWLVHRSNRLADTLFRFNAW